MPGRTADRPPTEPARVLVDTHTLVWALREPEFLGPAGAEALRDGTVLASVASHWELLLKKGKPEALLADPLDWWGKYVLGSGIRVLGIREAHVAALGRLADQHRDPFDRILVAQAIVERATLVSKDAALGKYGARVIW